MSNVRRALENWLKTIYVTGSVLDVGGLAMPVKGRTKSWDVSNYRVLDIKGGDYVADLNKKLIPYNPSGIFDYDIAFCLEVMEYIYNPFMALENINMFLKKGGVLYISTHFMFPHHSGGPDSLRYTRTGITRLLEKTGFKVEEITPRFAGMKGGMLEEWANSESKINKYPGQIGHMTKATKL